MSHHNIWSHVPSVAPVPAHYNSKKHITISTQWNGQPPLDKQTVSQHKGMNYSPGQPTEHIPHLRRRRREERARGCLVFQCASRTWTRPGAYPPSYPSVSSWDLVDHRVPSWDLVDHRVPSWDLLGPVVLQSPLLCQVSSSLRSSVTGLLLAPAQFLVFFLPHISPDFET